jgi:alpha-tubulin suppressor-like RCC1 family protein
VLTPTGSGTTCDDDGGKLCDGDGKCVACLQSTDCTSTTACVQVTCDGTHACVSMNAGAGDGCSDNGGAVCDGLGTCVACNQASDCALPSTVCVTGASCDAHACAYAYADEGTACTDNHGHFCDTVGQCYAAASVAVAFDHTCVVTTVGGLKCWGYDDSGDLVDGMNFMQPTPSDTMYTTGVARVVTGQTHTCVQTTGGAVKCYGADMENALGTGTSGTDQVVGLTSGVTQIAANGDGSVTCALLGATGGLKCWGANIGVGAGATPQDTPGLTSQVTAVSVGAFHLCAIVDDGSAFAPVMRCLGQNADGQLGDGTMNWSTMAPVDPGMQLVVAITTGDSWSCAASTQGYTWCWGSNNIGQLGADSTVMSSLSPRIVDNLLATSLASGSGHSCAITPQHKLMCWGWNFAGQIGNGTTTTQFGPAPVALPDDVASIGLGDKATCAVLKTGELYCWGNDQSFGGTGNHVTTPTKIPGF